MSAAKLYPRLLVYQLIGGQEIYVGKVMLEGQTHQEAVAELRKRLLPRHRVATKSMDKTGSLEVLIY